MNSNKYICPYCNCSMILSDGNHEHHEVTLKLFSGTSRQIIVDHYVCSNPDCGKSSLNLKINERNQAQHVPGGSVATRYHTTYSRRLIPTARAIVVPDCVPVQIAQDYTEACEIVDASPKAACALIRRCLQGMVRDFWKVSGRNLEKEIDAIKDKVDPETWQAIDSIRTIGNISAHMEKDVNIIVDVEPQEAELLISLVETLFDDWYVNREKRRERNAKLIETGKRKKEQRHPDKSATNSGK